MGKIYNLKTLQDIVDTIDEKNKENFLKDFRIFLEEVVKVKKMDPKPMITGFHWTDDDKEDYQVNLNIKLKK